MIFTTKIKKEVKAIAQDMAPEDTGNLKYNAIKRIDIPNGFEIVYSSTIAPYVNFLDFGTKFSRKHVGFINNTAVAISLHLENIQNNVPYDFQDTWNRLAANSKDNPARQMRLAESLGKIKID